jgi:hypothetical protein
VRMPDHFDKPWQSIEPDRLNNTILSRHRQETKLLWIEELLLKYFRTRLVVARWKASLQRIYLWGSSHAFERGRGSIGESVLLLTLVPFSKKVHSFLRLHAERQIRPAVKKCHLMFSARPQCCFSRCLQTNHNRNRLIFVNLHLPCKPFW